MTTSLMQLAIRSASLGVVLIGAVVLGGCSTGLDNESPAAASPSVASAPTPALTPEPPSPSPTPSATPGFGTSGPLQPDTYTTGLRGADTLTVTFTVPGGWDAFAEAGVLYGLIPNDEPGTGAPGGIAFQFRDVTTLKGDPCHWSGHDDDVPVGPTVDDLAQALREQTAYEASGPVDVVIGGTPANASTSSVRPSRTATMPMTPARLSGVTTASCGPGTASIYFQGPANRWQTNILDVDGTRLVIVVQDFAGTTAADRAELDTIVDSMVIEP